MSPPGPIIAPDGLPVGMEPGPVVRVLLSLVLLAMPWVCMGQVHGTGSAGKVSLRDLLCDRSVNPLGVDEAAPEFHWELSESSSEPRDFEQGAYQILVATSRAQLDRNRGDAWNSGKIAGGFTPSVAYGGDSLSSDTLYYWKVRVWDANGRPSPWSSPAMFLTGLLRPPEWQAKWIADAPDGPRLPQAKGNEDTRVTSAPPLPIFRTTFAVTKPIARATLFVAGLGESATFVNGHAITTAVLTPGWTDYRKTVLYDTYDITSRLHSGVNAMGIMLGNGMYNVPGVQDRYTKFIGSFGQPKLIAELHLHYADGSTSIVASNGRWRTTSGPVQFSSIYGGEDYDARQAPPGWTKPYFSDDSWTPAKVVEGPGGELHSERLPPVLPAHVYSATRATQANPDVTVYDLGQNFAGRPRITLSGPSGSEVSILPGELLDSTGRVTQASANAFPKDPVLFLYTLRGGAQEHWTPQFTYYGFRYAEVRLSGSPVLPFVARFDGEALRDAAAVNGGFSSSDTLLNRIHGLIDAAIRNNMVSVLTDCPTREKLGWLEQTYLAGPSILYNVDLSLLYRKMGRDMRDAQLDDGMVPSIAPEFVAFLDGAGHDTAFRDSPEWGSAMILSPWTAYTFYGDVQLLRDNYDSMVRYANYLQSRSHDGLIAYGLGDWYDIGPGAPGESQLTGRGMTATAIYYEDLTDLAKIAIILNKPDEAKGFADRAATVKASLNAHLFHAETGNYDRGSQTSNAMALALGLVPEGYRKAVLDNLVADIRKHQNHVTSGDIGFHYLVRALTDNGRSDVLYDMLMRTDSPSYGYQLAQGATALTEAWDSNPNSSQDHFMLGHAEEWFYRGLAGIDFDLSRERDRRIWIHPQVVGHIDSAQATYHSVLGPISSSWRREGDALHLDVVIPAGATATISLPPEFIHTVLESSRRLRGDEGILSIDENSTFVSCVVGSGTYHFTAQR